MIAWLVSAALAADLHVVHRGESVERLAGGDPAVAAAIRAANGLAPDAQPAVGAVLTMPPGAGHQDVHGELVWSVGEATRARADGPSAPVKVGDAVEVGDLVCTGARSYATVRLSGVAGGAHHEVNLFPETCVVVEALGRKASVLSSAVRVARGGLFVRDDALAGGVTVRTPAAIAVGTGGFRVRVEAERTLTEALASPVAVFGAGEQVDLAANQGNETRAGRAPGGPVDLLAPGRPVRPDAGAILGRADFVWTSVDGALGYRFEVCARADGSEPLLQEDIADEAFHPDVLVLPFRVDGLYWRVSSFDRTGLLGRPSAPRAFAPPPGVGP